MKKILKYIGIFNIVLVILVSLLILVAMIPKKYIEKNVENSIEHYEKQDEVYQVKKKRGYTYIHNEADANLLNIIYCLDSENPISSVLEARYYKSSVNRANYDLVECVNDKLDANTEYSRYWHGSIIIVKILLIFFEIDQIYIVNVLLLSVLLIILLTLLLKKRYFILTFSFIIGLIMTYSIAVPFCLEYVWIYYIMLIITIIAVINEKKDDSFFYKLFFISGILTAFFDFLTTELITVVIPIIMVISIKYEKDRINSLREILKFLLISMILWLLAYTLTFIFKWAIATLILNKNIFEIAMQKMLIRMNGDIIYVNNKDIYKIVLLRNFENLYLINIMFVIVFLLVLSIIFRKKGNYFPIILLFISFIPYVRYVLLSNHSYMHYFFTFRAQLITIMGFILSSYYFLDKEKLKMLKEYIWKKN